MEEISTQKRYWSDANDALNHHRIIPPPTSPKSRESLYFFRHHHTRACLFLSTQARYTNGVRRARIILPAMIICCACGMLSNDTGSEKYRTQPRIKKKSEYSVLYVVRDCKAGIITKGRAKTHARIIRINSPSSYTPCA